MRSCPNLQAECILPVDPATNRVRPLTVEERFRELERPFGSRTVGAASYSSLSAAATGSRLSGNPRQRHSTVVLRAPKTFINTTLWPEYLEIAQALEEYLNRATERIIQEEVFGDAAEAQERPGNPKDSAAVGFSLEGQG